MELLVIHPCDIELALKVLIGVSTLILTWYLLYRAKQFEEESYKIRYKYQNKPIKKIRKWLQL